jgi:PilZ domain-containing protein
MVTNMTANYWEGSGPGIHSVRDISCGGAFILADFKWVAGTVVTMTLQFESQGAVSSSRATTVQARVVRHATEGIGVQFSTADKGEQKRLTNFLKSIMPSE